MVKKEMTEEGEVQIYLGFSFPPEIQYLIQHLMPTLYLFTKIFYSQGIRIRFVKVVCKLITIALEPCMHQRQRFADLNVPGYFQIIPYHLESMDFGTEIDGTEDFFQMFWPIIVSHKIGKIWGQLSTKELWAWKTFNEFSIDYLFISNSRAHSRIAI